jgi:hypothetical protein
MSLWSQENARLILDRLCEHPSVTAAAKMIGSQSKIIWVWARASSQDKTNNVADSKYIIHGWPDDSDDSPPLYFHEAMQLARNIHALNLDHDTREMLGGIERPVIEGGKFQYVVDPLAVAQFKDAEEALTFGGLDDWPFAHDERGARIVLTVKEHVPAQLRIHALRALMGGIYNVAERSESNVKTQSSVLVLHGNTPRPNREATPLRMDLEARLTAIRNNPSRDSAKPTGPVNVGSTANTNDPPERISAPSDQTPTTVEELTAPPPRPAPPNYGRPTNNLNAEDRIGMPSGGFKVR